CIGERERRARHIVPRLRRRLHGAARRGGAEPPVTDQVAPDLDRRVEPTRRGIHQTELLLRLRDALDARRVSADARRAVEAARQTGHETREQAPLAVVAPSLAETAQPDATVAIDFRPVLAEAEMVRVEASV